MRLAPVAAVIALVLVAGCGSPEARRSRGGGPGADRGNRGPVVEMHEGSWIYHQTPQIIQQAHPDLEPARQAQRLSQRGR